VRNEASGIFEINSMCMPKTPLTETEEMVVQTLINEPASELTTNPAIHAVDAKMRWATIKTRAFVDDLVERKIIVVRASAVDSHSGERSKWWYERVRDGDEA
jgi:hypothetical protein